MKLFVISDTHRRTDKAVEIYQSLSGIDLILHLGDNAVDGERIKRETGARLIGVNGNTDGAFSKQEYRIIETEFGKIFLTHGHMEHVKESLNHLIYKAEELGCRAAFFGHTHVPLFREMEGMYLLNPGSLSLPTAGVSGSYAVATTGPDSLAATIFYI